MPTSIWVDADACPKVIKDVLFRAAVRTKTRTTLVSNHPLIIPPSPFIKKIQVAAGFDVADSAIIEYTQSGDLIITADIPLANAVVAKGGVALDPRGELYSENNVKERLSIRNFHAELRNAGMLTGGVAKLSNRETQAFANCLDKFLSNC